MHKKSHVVFTVFGMLLTVLFAAHDLAAQILTKTETITWYDVQVEAVKTADNFIVLFNTAKTMGRPYKDTTIRHIDAAKEILQERNKLLPNLPYKAGLYTFAPTSLAYTESLKAHYPMQPYNKEAFAQAIQQLPSEAKGKTEILLALDGLEPVLKDLTGRTVVFLFTDGINPGVATPTTILKTGEKAPTPRELVQETRDISVATRHGVPRSTAYG